MPVPPSPPRRLVVNPLKPEPSALEAAAYAILAGGFVGLPTETFYALAADGLSWSAVSRVLEVKGRDTTKPVGLLASDIDMVQMVAKRIPDRARVLMATFWPGPLNLVLPGKDSLPPGVLGIRKGVSIRVPDSVVAREVIRRVGGPVTATSANLYREKPSRTAEEVLEALGDHLETVVDIGPTAGGLPSTMVDVRGKRPILLREGAVPWEEVIACYR